jgi:hypothetical protein
VRIRKVGLTKPVGEPAGGNTKGPAYKPQTGVRVGRGQHELSDLVEMVHRANQQQPFDSRLTTPSVAGQEIG